ncbi:MAG: hypothetical protein PUB22_05695, partial [Clostridiales bacterium]|nr:hypothetical protein [Clostridiales bacterium]
MKIRQKILSSVLMIVMLLAMCSTVFAAGASSGSANKAAAASYQDVDAITELPIDYTQSAQVPLEGWYSKTLESGRTVKMYIPEYAACRAYFTVVAAPAGVKDIQVWAEKQGYTDLMEERGEILAVLEADKKWTDLETELAYVTEAMNFVNSGKNANGITLFTNYSTFYLIGYEGGAAPLEAWSAEHPILVDSQVFINGKSAGYQYLSEVGQKIYDGTNTGGYDPGIADLDEFEKVLAEHGYEGKAITRSEVAVPTWFVNYSSFDYSVRYWKSANDCKVIPNGFLLNRTYWQSKDSDAFQTEYANSCTEENHGISQVKMSYALYVPA